MRLMIFALLALLSVAPGPAQEKAPPAQGEMVSAVIPVKTLTGDAFNRLVKLLSAFDVKFSADDRLRTVVVYAPPKVVAEMKKVIAELDRPGSDLAVGRNVDVTLSFLRATTGAEDDSALPANLQSVAKQLRSATQYRRIELWEVLPIRLQEGQPAGQMVRLPAKPLGIEGPTFPTASIDLRPEAIVTKDGRRALRLDRLRVNLRVPYSVGGTNYMFQDLAMNTSGDFGEGQKTVVGKVGLNEDSAVFIVVEVKVVD